MNVTTVSSLGFLFVSYVPRFGDEEGSNLKIPRCTNNNSPNKNPFSPTKRLGNRQAQKTECFYTITTLHKNCTLQKKL
jgi:hypothetical protein